MDTNSVPTSSTTTTAANLPVEGFRERLLERRRHVEAAVDTSLASTDIAGRLSDIDAALARLDDGTFGICEACRLPVESDRLVADPLERYCLGDLTSGQRRSLEHDLELSARIQAALLPARRQRFSNWELAYDYRPLGVVSGDHCDVFRSTDDGLYFVLGDVSGKGVSAGILMSNLHATFRALLGTALPLTEVARRANSLFCAGTPASAYATLALGRLDRDGSLELVNAGHCPPLVSRGSGIESIGPTGFPLGMFGDSHFGSEKLRLEPGDRLLVYTDGLSEASNVDGNELGIDAIAYSLSRFAGDAHSTVEAVLAVETAHRGAAERSDDLTVFAVALH